MIKDILKYNRYRSIEERVWCGIFWVGVLVLFLWIEICVGIAIARVLLVFD